MRGFVVVGCAIAVGLCSGFLGADAEDARLPEIVVRLEAGADGALAQLILGERRLGNDASAFKRLNQEILRIIGKPDNPLTSNLVVVLYVGPDVKFSDASKAVSACIGREDEATGKFIRYIGNVRIVTSDAELSSGN